METSESLKRKVSSATDLLSIVKTMKVHASASIRQYERAVEALREYNRTVELGFQYLMKTKPVNAQARAADHSGSLGLIVIGSDQGMCGQFNEQVGAFTLTQLRLLGVPLEKVKIFVIGARVIPRLEDGGCPVEELYPVPSSTPGMTALIQELLSRLEHWRSSFNIERVSLVYNRRERSAVCVPSHTVLLPIDRQFLAQFERSSWQGRSLPLHRMSWDQLFSQLVRQYVFVALFRALAESLQSENASRLASMQRAEKNIDELLEELVRQRNHLRQETITEELLDIISGSEALQGKGPKTYRQTGIPYATLASHS